MRSLVQNSYPTFWGHLRGTPPLNYLACVGTEDYAKSFKTPINTPKKNLKKKRKKKGVKEKFCQMDLREWEREVIVKVGYSATANNFLSAALQWKGVREGD